MKRTEKYIDEILNDLTNNKKELHNIATELLIEHFYEKIAPRLATPTNVGSALCDPLIKDLKEKISLFLKAEGYNK